MFKVGKFGEFMYCRINVFVDLMSLDYDIIQLLIKILFIKNLKSSL